MADVRTPEDMERLMDRYGDRMLRLCCMYLNDEHMAQEALVDYLNSCTATAYQTGNIEPLEHMERVVTTIHELIGDYDEMERNCSWPTTPADIDEL